jgi:antitoxin CptB
MTAEANSGEDGLEMRRRRLRFRAWHRGMREVDLLLGRFADAHLDALDEDELAGFEALLLVPDPDVLSWITGEAEVPSDDNSPLVRKLLAFHGTGSNGKSDRK